MGFLLHSIITPFFSLERRSEEAVEKELMVPQSTKKKQKKVVFWRGNDPTEAETSTAFFFLKLPRKVDYNQMLKTIETYNKKTGAADRNKKRRA